MSAALSRWLALASVALALFGAACALAAGRPGALPTGAALIVIAPAAPSAEDRESEAYGDYAEYLNAFAAHRPAGVRLVRMTPAQWRRQVRQPQPSDSYAIAFLRRGGQVLFYDGMPVEPAVYADGARWATGGAAPSADIGFTQRMLVRH